MWRYSVFTNRWIHLNGNQTTNLESDYNVPYPGGTFDHVMCEVDNYFYLFGGKDNTPGMRHNYFNNRKL